MSCIHGYFELTRLHKPFLGNTLLFWPCAWGLTIAARVVALPLACFTTTLLLFGLGSMLLHSAACVLNDICDVKFDRQIARTKDRSLPAGKVSLSGAWTLCCALLLSLFFSLGALGIFPLSALYPLMKRWTWWPQAWLGLTFGWGIPVAWTTITGMFPPIPVWVLYAGGVCWTIIFDTIYACQDWADNSRVGVRSTALLFGKHTRPALVSIATIMLLCLVCAGYQLRLGVGFSILLCGGTLVHMMWQVTTWDEADPKDHHAKFKVSS
ncbi:UbiA prenyltransferase [Dichomitus squalens LYAD-421 SS1]|uniref:UbiA prenyltransferase n=1 Tax=Dichomitus squalens (strain LYAD-421) TaxID=732165 RepID=R7SNZ9_DICSQ|nr:UbiA prenyltransferase [Dichomitus squalens LYAD-421 SS1]EJF57816.1 UbiA prenyltransferase [Dichomitus squalens LYAD-421 SS1]